jgi:hypothetical protein
MGRVYAVAMGRTGLYISELARRGGTTRKALRLYETAGILPASRRTAAGQRGVQFLPAILAACPSDISGEYLATDRPHPGHATFDQ